ncbi:Unannotated [Lentimonas sp. CC8]|nr:Unannotated [Lentimonas sp. CC8]
MFDVLPQLMVCFVKIGVSMNSMQSNYDIGAGGQQLSQ